MAALIQLRGVTKSYQEGSLGHRVLAEVDLTIDEREWVVVLGRSGSGKSTLLNLLAAIDLPDSGQILFEGRDLVRASERDRTLWRRGRVGFVFQFFNLIPTLTVEENVRLPLELNRNRTPPGRGDRAQRAVENERVLELLGFVGLASRARSYPDVLSGGEQQRVALARALAADPPLILADEPTGNLDVETAETVLSLLERAVVEHGKTLVMATHSLEVAARAHRVLEVQQGRLVVRASPNPRASS